MQTRIVTALGLALLLALGVLATMLALGVFIPSKVSAMSQPTATEIPDTVTFTIGLGCGSSLGAYEQNLGSSIFSETQTIAAVDPGGGTRISIAPSTNTLALQDTFTVTADTTHALVIDSIDLNHDGFGATVSSNTAYNNGDENGMATVVSSSIRPPLIFPKGDMGFVRTVNAIVGCGPGNRGGSPDILSGTRPFPGLVGAGWLG